MRKFLIKLSYTVLPAWLATMALVVYYHTAVAPNMNGEMGPLAKLPFPVEHKDNVDISVKYYTDVERLEAFADTVVDVITVGDSFSQQWLGSYENFLAATGVSVANFHVKGNMFQIVYDMINLGYVDSLHVKTIVVESGERYTVERIRQFKTGNTRVSFTPIDNTKKAREATPLIEAKNYLLLRLGYKRPVRHVNVSRDFFLNDDGRNLYFLEEDLDKLSVTDDDAAVMRRNIDTINALAAEKGIRLVYLICPDKYSTYQDYIVNNPYPAKTINEGLKRIFAADTTCPWLFGIDVTAKAVQEGEKDVYPLSSTHWSWKQAQRVAEKLRPLVM